MLFTLSTCLLWLTLSGLQTIQAEDSHENMSTRSPYRNLAPNNADFAFSLFKNLVALNPNKDILISPISISMALSMLTLGAGGHTRSQMLNGLGFKVDEITETEIHKSFQHLHDLLRLSDMHMGSTLFHNQSLNLMELFSADTKRYYGLENLPVDFQDRARSSSQINEYIKDKTQGEISDLFLELESTVTIILINYVFFTGTWEHIFNPEDTRLGDFYVDDTTVVQVPMMFQSSNVKHMYDPELGCLVVQLDYVGNSTAFLILPDREQMDTVSQALSRETLDRWASSMINSRVELYVPRLSLSGNYDLGDIMKATGIADLWNNQTDLSHITSNVQQKLSKVIHKTNLRITEKGKEAAAPPVSTSGGQGETAQLTKIQINRPFILMIFDNVSWSSLFLGKVVNPS
ncbi:corticosteroid-binding globulin-like [Sorex araneus]|uniref:corticosteroid-binding globulin-like n=1 Tax=Sorex araneus TaxID=42254 RepID=UPI0024335C15|nr:corticosteroid-binding globulin-like [Sorex araneus]